MKPEQAILIDYARELFGDEPDDEMLATAGATIGFRFAVVDQRIDELLDELRAEIWPRWRWLVDRIRQRR